MEDLLPVEVTFDEEEVMNFMVVDLKTGFILGYSESCSYLFGLFPLIFRKLQNFKLKAVDIFPEYESFSAQI